MGLGVEGERCGAQPGGLGLQDQPRPRRPGGSVLALSRARFLLDSHMDILILILILIVVARGCPFRTPPWVHSQEVVLTVRGERMSLKPVQK